MQSGECGVRLYVTEVFCSLWCFHTRARQRLDNDKTNVEPVHSYYAFHTRSDMSGVKDIIGMHWFNICLVVVLSLSSWCYFTRVLQLCLFDLLRRDIAITALAVQRIRPLVRVMPFLSLN